MMENVCDIVIHGTDDNIETATIVKVWKKAIQAVDTDLNKSNQSESIWNTYMYFLYFETK